MIDLSIIPDGETAQPLADLDPETILGHPEPLLLSQVIGIANGTENGKPVVLLRIDHEDGSTTIAQTTLALFLSAGDAIKARHGDPRS